MCFLAMLPAANVWVIAALDRQHHSEREWPSAVAAHLSAADESGKPRTREIDTVQSTVVAIAPIASPLAASSPLWLTSEPAIALLANAVLFSAALAFALSAALSAGRASSRSGYRDVPREAHLLAEQFRCDIGDMAHAMRSPIAVITAYADRLKSVIPADDARAQRAIDAVSISGAQLNRLLDSAWRRGDELASLFLAERCPVDLAAILVDAMIEESETGQSGSIVIGRVSSSSVSAPPGVMDRIVDELLTMLLCHRSNARVVATVETTDGLACLHLALEEALVALAAPAASSAIAGLAELSSPLEEMPLFVGVKRTVSMLGGHLTATSGEGGVTSITMVLPEAGM